MGVMGAQRWSEADDQYVRDAMPVTASEVDTAARTLGRTRHAVRYRVRRHRGRVQHTWADAEDRELLAVTVTPHTARHAGRSAFADIAHKLGVSVDAARCRYHLLKRKAGHPGGQWTTVGLWTPKEDGTVLRALPDYGPVPSGTWVDVALILGRTPGAVRLRAYNLRRYMAPPHPFGR